MAWSSIQGAPRGGVWIPSHWGIPSNDIVDILEEDASNLPYPEKPDTYPQAVADSSRKSVILVSNAHKQQAQTRAWETKVEKIHLVYLEVPLLPNLATSTDMAAYSDTWIGFDYPLKAN